MKLRAESESGPIIGPDVTHFHTPGLYVFLSTRSFVVDFSYTFAAMRVWNMVPGARRSSFYTA